MSLAPSIGDRIEAFGSERFFNRELSWLEFNKRVLEEAGNERNPLLERVRFLAISGSNLDEFYRVRVAGLHEQAITNILEVSPDGLTPKQQLEMINAEVALISERQQARWTELQNELAKESITLLTAKALSGADKEWLQSFFMRRIFSALSAVAVDAAHPFPHVQSQELVLVLDCERQDEGEPRRMLALVVVPNGIDRFIKLPPTGRDSRHTGTRFIAVENFIPLFADRLLPGFRIKDAGLFRPLRNSEIEFQEKSEDLQKTLRRALVQRQLGEVIRLEISAALPESARQLIMQGLKIGPEDVVVTGGLFAIADISQLTQRAARPPLQAFRDPVSRAHRGVWRRLPGRHLIEGHRRPSPLRVLRHRPAISASGGDRSRCCSNQMDALPHVAKIACRRSPPTREGGGQERNGHDRGDSAL